MSDIVGNQTQGVDGRRQNCLTEEFETEHGLCGGQSKIVFHLLNFFS
jgi:hypothetical protein